MNANINITEFLDKEEEFITFVNIKTQLNKIILFDRPNLNYYELILKIINTFEDGLINEYKTHFYEYTQIFKILQTMKIPINEISNLKKIIIWQ